MTGPGREFGDRLRAERRRFEVFRKGRVTLIDDSVDPVLLTVHDGERSRQMPYIRANVSVGDVVRWVDQSDPFAWGRELSDGGAVETPFILGAETFRLWYPERDLDAANHATFLTPRTAITQGGVMFQYHTYGKGQTTAAFDSIDNLVEDHGHPVTASWPAPPYAEPSFSTIYQDVGGMTLCVSTDVGADNIGPPMFRLSGWSYEDRTPVGLSNRFDTDVGYIHSGYGVARGLTSIREAQWATATTDLVGGSKTYFPSISTPGPNWGLIYILHVPNIDHDALDGGNGVSVTRGVDNTDAVTALAGFSSVAQGVSYYRARTVGAGDPEAWIQPATDIPGCMLSSVVLNAA